MLSTFLTFFCCCCCFQVIYESINEHEAIIAEEQVSAEDAEMIFTEEQLEGQLANQSSMKPTSSHRQSE